MDKKALFISCVVLAYQFSLAQKEVVVPEAKTLPEIVITSTKFEVPLKETSRAVQIITKQQIEQSSGKDIAQILQQQSGLIINGAYSNPSSVKGIFMRGAKNEFTLILIDGVPINDPSGITAGALDLRLLPLAQIERIEIIKGNQSSLYGSGAIAGVINIITKKKGEDKIGVSGNLAVGSLNTGNGAINVGGNSKPVQYNVGVQHTFTAGISEAKAPAGKSFDPDKWTLTAASASLGFSVTEHLTISPYIRFMKNEGDYDDGAFADADNQSTSELMHTGGFIDYKTKKWKTRMAYGYAQTDRVFKDNFGTRQYQGFLHDVDGYVSYDLSNTFNFLAGMNYQAQNMFDGTKSLSSSSVSILSPYLNAILKPTKKLIIELGYRFNAHSKYGGYSTYSFAPAYWITGALKLFTSYSTGYKAPTLSQLYGPYGANESLQPQTSNSWEAGVQSYLANDKLNIMVTYYERQIDNLIVYQSDSLTLPSYYQNRDIQYDRGVETSLEWTDIKGKLNLRVTYDFVVGNITEHRPSLGDTTYNNLIRRPKHSLKTTIEYRPIPAFLVSLSGQYIGNRTDLFFDLDGTKIRDMDAYLLLNAYLEYRIMGEKVNLFADLKNISDTDYTETYGYSTLGFNAQFGLRFRW